VKRHQRGMSLIVAIFLITAIALLSAAAVSVGRASTESTNELLLADRSRAAAEAGLEWAAYRVMVQAVPCATVNGQLLQLNLSGLRGFRVTVTCQRATNPAMFDITAFAQSGNFGQTTYASHTLSRRFN
jgi:type II secretory pathway component PulK